MMRLTHFDVYQLLRYAKHDKKASEDIARGSTTLKEKAGLLSVCQVSTSKTLKEKVSLWSVCQVNTSKTMKEKASL